MFKDYFIETGLWLGYTSYFVAKIFQILIVNLVKLIKSFFNIGSIDNLKIELNKSPEALYDLNKHYGDLIFNKKCCILD